VILDAGEDVGEILEGIDPARLARRHQRLQARKALSAIDVVDEEVVLATEGHAAERTFRAVVVQGDALVVGEDAELLPRLSA
jgi:hypothetical protein